MWFKIFYLYQSQANKNTQNLTNSFILKQRVKRVKLQYLHTSPQPGRRHSIVTQGLPPPQLEQKQHENKKQNPSPIQPHRFHLTHFLTTSEQSLSAQGTPWSGSCIISAFSFFLFFPSLFFCRKRDPDTTATTGEERLGCWTFRSPVKKGNFLRS